MKTLIEKLKIIIEQIEVNHQICSEKTAQTIFLISAALLKNRQIDLDAFINLAEKNLDFCGYQNGTFQGFNFIDSEFENLLVESAHQETVNLSLKNEDMKEFLARVFSYFEKKLFVGGRNRKSRHLGNYRVIIFVKISVYCARRGVGRQTNCGDTTRLERGA